MRARYLLAAVLLLSSGGGLWAKPHTPGRGTVTGAALPRFSSLRASEVNLRRGPGLRYPIDWVYHRKGLPVEILREFDAWRRVRTADGTTGWVFHSLLTSKRGFIVTAVVSTMRRAPRADARPVAHLHRGVVGRLLECPAESSWCRGSVNGLSGYLRRTAIWGDDTAN